MIINERLEATAQNRHTYSQATTDAAAPSVISLRDRLATRKLATRHSDSLVASQAVAVSLKDATKGDISGDNTEITSSVAASPQSRRLTGPLTPSFRFGKNEDLAGNNAAIDLIAVITCFYSVHFLYLGNLDLTSSRSLVLISSLVFICSTLLLGGAYTAKRNISLGREIAILLVCWSVAFASVGLFTFLSKTAVEVSRVWITLSFATSFLVFALFRAISRIEIVNRSAGNKRNIIICGFELNIDSTIDCLNASRTHNFDVTGVFKLNKDSISMLDSKRALQLYSRPIINYVESQRASGTPVEQVWLALPSSKSDLIQQLALSLHDSSVDICVVPDAYTERLLGGETTPVGNTAVVNISEISLTPAADQFKRIFDVVLASFGLAVLAIPMAIIACIVKLDSKGPALFRQKRYGVDGKEIEVYKFRSMKLHSDDQVVQATRNDTKVTAVGCFLRRTSLDELPQLINVVQGTMSLVGPRPHAVVHNEMWRTQIYGYMLRHKVRPGITGLAQVSGWRGETETEYKMRQRVKYDLKYIKDWSPYLDVKILFLTVFNGFTGENAY